MSAPKLKQGSSYLYHILESESSDSESYAKENELLLLDVPVERLFTADFAAINSLSERVKKVGLYQQVKSTGSPLLLLTFTYLERSVILLRRQLGRVWRHIGTLDDHVMYRVSMLESEPSSGTGIDSGTAGYSIQTESKNTSTAEKAVDAE